MHYAIVERTRAYHTNEPGEQSSVGMSSAAHTTLRSEATKEEIKEISYTTDHVKQKKRKET